MRGGRVGKRERQREVNEQRLDKTGKEKGRMLARQRKKETERSRDTSGGRSTLVW